MITSAMSLNFLILPILDQLSFSLLEHTTSSRTSTAFDVRLYPDSHRFRSHTIALQHLYRPSGPGR